MVSNEHHILRWILVVHQIIERREASGQQRIGGDLRRHVCGLNVSALFFTMYFKHSAPPNTHTHGSEFEKLKLYSIVYKLVVEISGASGWFNP